MAKKKIREYNKEDFNLLASQLQKLSVWLTGKPIDDFGLDKTMKTLSESWADFSIDEIELSIDMAMADTLSPHEKIELRANFLSPKYLFDCMRLYRVYRGEVMVKYWNEVEKENDIQLQQARETSPEIKKSIIKKDFERYKKRGEILLGSVCYDYLVELDQFDPDIWKEYQELAEQAVYKERSEEGKLRKSTIRAQNLLSSITPQTISSRAKSIAVEEYFKTIDTEKELGLD